jgi:hypothetical protein
MENVHIIGRCEVKHIIGRCEVKHIMMLLIKTMTSVLESQHMSTVLLFFLS